MTPKLRLREHARKALLSSMRKLCLPGKRRTNTSTQMTEAPKTQAEGISDRHDDETGRRTDAADDAHDPPAGVIVEFPCDEVHGGLRSIGMVSMSWAVLGCLGMRFERGESEAEEKLEEGKEQENRWMVSR